MSDIFLVSKHLSFSEFEGLMGELKNKKYGRFAPLGGKEVQAEVELENLRFEDLRALTLPEDVAEASLKARSYPSVPEEQQKLVPAVFGIFSAVFMEVPSLRGCILFSAIIMMNSMRFPQEIKNIMGMIY